MALVGAWREWSAGTQQGVIRDALLEALEAGNGSSHAPYRRNAQCPICTHAWRALVPRLGDEPLKFYSNVNGSRVELPHGRERSVRMRQKVYEVHAYMTGDPRDCAPSPAVVAEPGPTVAPEPPKAAAGLSEAHTRFLAEVRRIRAFATDREIDHISYRPVKDGARMISAGIPVEACLFAMTMHWDDHVRRQANIRTYDPAAEFPGGLDAYLRTLVDAGVLIMLTGPAGMGKSFWCEQLADRLGLPFGSLACNEQATTSWLYGKDTFSGFKSTEFLRIWSEGGVFLFDEMDASDSNFLLAINNALANGSVKNPIDQETYKRSDRCIIMAATNTLGLGADADYTGRNALDFSTLDRFRMGRAFVGYNADIEEHILLSNAA